MVVLKGQSLNKRAIEWRHHHTIEKDYLCFDEIFREEIQRLLQWISPFASEPERDGQSLPTLHPQPTSFLVNALYTRLPVKMTARKIMMKTMILPIIPVRPLTMACCCN